MEFCQTDETLWHRRERGPQPEHSEGECNDTQVNYMKESTPEGNNVEKYVGKTRHLKSFERRSHNDICGATGLEIGRCEDTYKSCFGNNLIAKQSLAEWTLIGLLIFFYKGVPGSAASYHGPKDMHIRLIAHNK